MVKVTIRLPILVATPTKMNMLHFYLPITCKKSFFVNYFWQEIDY